MHGATTVVAAMLAFALGALAVMGDKTAFSSLAEARAVLAAWRDDYNRVRPHSALANRTPEEFCNHTWPLPQRPAMGKTLTQDFPSEWRKEVSQVTAFPRSCLRWPWAAGRSARSWLAAFPQGLRRAHLASRRRGYGDALLGICNPRRRATFLT